MRKIVLTYGLISGVILSAMMLLTVPFMDEIGFDRGAVIGYTSMVAAFLLVYFGVRSYRDSVGQGKVSFGRAFAVGMLITMVASACYVATWQVVYRKFTPDFMDKYAAHEIEKARTAGETDAQLAKRTEDMKRFAVAYQNPLVNIAWTFLEPLPVALVFTLGTAFALSRRRRDA